MRTECIVDPGEEPRLTVRVRCLQVQHRDDRGARRRGRRSCPSTTLDVDGRRGSRGTRPSSTRSTSAPSRCSRRPTRRARTVRAARRVDDVEDLRRRAAARRRAGPPAARAGRRRRAGRGRLGGRRRASVPEGRRSTVENTTDWVADAGADRDDADAPLARRRAHAARGRRRRASSRCSTRRRSPTRRVAGCVQRRHRSRCWSATAERRRDAVVADHPLRPPRGRARERRRPLRRDRDRRDPRTAGADADRRREGRGARHRPAGRGIIDRCDDMPPEVWERLHGAMRGSLPAECAPSRPTRTAESVPWWDPAVDASFDPWTDTC